MTLLVRCLIVVLFLMPATSFEARAQATNVRSTYVDPERGWVLSWADPWSLLEGGGAAVWLKMGDSSYIKFINSPESNPVTCLSTAARDARASAPWLHMLTDASGAPIQGQAEGVAWEGFVYESRADGTTFIVYAECRAPAAGQGALLTMYYQRLAQPLARTGAQQLASERLAGQAIEINALLANLVVPGFYANPLFGYNFVWDPTVWAIIPPDPTNELVGSSAVGVELTDGVGRLTVAPRVEFGGDAPACLAGVVAMDGVTPALRDGQPIGGPTAAGVSYGIYEVSPGAMLRGPARAYFECRELVPGAATLVGAYVAPIPRFDAGTTAAVEVLDSVQILPVAEAASPVDPRAAPPPPIDPRAAEPAPSPTATEPPTAPSADLEASEAAETPPPAPLGTPAEPSPTSGIPDSSPGAASPIAGTGAAPAFPIEVAVVETETIDLAGGHALGMSPDGQWLAVASTTSQLCLEPVADPSQPARCVVPEEAGFDRFDPRCRLPETYSAWSPNSLYFALTECGGPFFDLRDTDIWVLSVVSGTLINLTDDGFTDYLWCDSRNGATAWADVFPAWSPDSQTIAFVRTDFVNDCLPDSSGAAGTFLYTVPVTGGPARLVTKIADEPFVVSRNPVWTPEGDHILYGMRNEAAPSAPQNGLWTVDVLSGEPHRLLPSSPEFGNPFPLAVRAQGDLVLVGYTDPPDPQTQFSAVPGVRVLLDLDTQTTTPIEPAPEAPYGSVVLTATFSPDGSQLLTLEYWQGSKVLIAREVGAETGVELFHSDVIDQSLRPRWTSADSLFVRLHDQSGILLQLAETGAGATNSAAAPITS